jgi:4-oxalocrotonate tautomerase
MPYVNIRITREGNTTAAQKARVIHGVTEVLREVLQKDPATTFVVIDEVELESWGVGGMPVEAYRRRAQRERS